MGKAVERKRKKKGRPSLLDLQKRSLRLQKQHEQQQHRKRNPGTSTNPYARFPNPPNFRRPSRRNPNPDPSTAYLDIVAGEPEASVEDDEEEDEPTGRRKERKLKLVLHLPQAEADFPDAPYSASDSDGASPKRRKINAAEKREEAKSSLKATEDPQGETSDLGPTTPLPDKNLLEFILDRLQKKDIYGVFSEPVDPDELPDYLDIIKHPMDFGTVRSRLSNGFYKNLEQFENDVLLISSNAMHYNASDTIYFRQARSIHELAKKNFVNLRQESDDSELKPKVLRRGRPPGTGKNNNKRPVGKPYAEDACSEYSSEAHLLPNAVNRNHFSNPWYDFLRKGTVLHKAGAADAFASPAPCVQSSEAYIPSNENKTVRSEDYSGSVWKGSLNSGNNILSTDDNRRDTYKHYPLSFTHELPLFTALGGERKVLVPVGLHAEHAYAGSLVRFSANLGPIGWKLAAIRIKRALPQGTQFGPGWVRKSDDPQPFQHPPPSASRADECSERLEELPFNGSAEQEYQSRTPRIPSSPNVYDASEVKALSQFCQVPMMKPSSNGFKAPFAPNMHCPGKFH